MSELTGVGPRPAAEAPPRTLVQPGLGTLARLAAGKTVGPVWCEVLADVETPVSAFLKLGDERSFLLESVIRGERWGRFSFLGRDPHLVMKSKGDTVTWEGEAPAGTVGGDPLVMIESLLERYRAPRLDGLPPLHSGLVGYWGYETVRFIEPRVPVSNPDHLGVPDVLLAATGTVVAFDHFRQRLVLIRNVYLDDLDGRGDVGELRRRYNDGLDELERLRAELRVPAVYPPVAPHFPAEVPDARSNRTKSDFCAAVEAAKEYILAGDVFQVQVSQRFSRPLTVDPFAVHRALRLVSPSPYMSFIRHPEVTIVSASPEELVRFSDGRVHARPLAGTRRRGRTDEEDAALAGELLGDPKERAEHVMLVDLARNDLGRVGAFGTVHVGELMVVERYSHVMHIVSSVDCRTRPGVRPVDVFRATFPAGTVTGAPKVRAMEIIDELEPTQRGPYAGVMGYVDFSGSMDLAITLRTAVIKDGVAHVQAAGGVVADSVPELEYKETRNKARGVLAAVEAAERMRWEDA